MSIEQTSREHIVLAERERHDEIEEHQPTTAEIVDHMDAEENRAATQISERSETLCASAPEGEAAQITKAAEQARMEIHGATREAKNAVILEETLERLGIKRLPSTEELNQLYGYIPPKTEQAPAQELGIEWTPALMDQIRKEMLDGIGEIGR